MDLVLDEELATHLREILAFGKSEAEWAEIESDDMFQSESYCGGFDADEMAFTFGYFAYDEQEYWFQFELGEVTTALTADRYTFKARPADL